MRSVCIKIPGCPQDSRDGVRRYQLFADNAEILFVDFLGPVSAAQAVPGLLEAFPVGLGLLTHDVLNHKGSGNVGTPGCVSFMFDKKGQIIVAKEECEMDADDLMMTALDAGAEDFVEEEDSFEILTDPDSFSEVRLTLEEAGIPMASAEVTMIPQTWVQLTDETDLKNIQKTLDLLEEDDDVQEVYHNWEE